MSLDSVKLIYVLLTFMAAFTVIPNIQGMKSDLALSEIQGDQQTQFSPPLVNCFLRVEPQSLAHNSVFVQANNTSQSNRTVNAVFVFQDTTPDGYTESIQFVNDSIPPHQSEDERIPWYPEIGGNHTMTVFAVDDMRIPLVITDIKSRILPVCPFVTHALPMTVGPLGADT